MNILKAIQETLQDRMISDDRLSRLGLKRKTQRLHTYWIDRKGGGLRKSFIK